MWGHGKSLHHKREHREKENTFRPTRNYTLQARKTNRFPFIFLTVIALIWNKCCPKKRLWQKQTTDRDSDWRLSRHWTLGHDLSEIPCRNQNEIDFLCGYVNSGKQKARFDSVSPLRTWVKAFRISKHTQQTPKVPINNQSAEESNEIFTIFEADDDGDGYGLGLGMVTGMGAVF